MRTVNKVILIGNITKDPFVKTTTHDKKVAMFTVATNRQYKNPKGEIMSEAEYTHCITWGNLAERCEQFLTKGKLVYIEGHLKTRSLEKEDGSKFFKTEVVATNLIFLNKKEEGHHGTPHEEIDGSDDVLDIIEEIDFSDDKF